MPFSISALIGRAPSYLSVPLTSPQLRWLRLNSTDFASAPLAWPQLRWLGLSSAGIRPHFGSVAATSSISFCIIVLSAVASPANLWRAYAEIEWAEDEHIEEEPINIFDQPARAGDIEVFEHFLRANSREQAKAALREEFPNIRFYR